MMRALMARGSNGLQNSHPAVSMAYLVSIAYIFQKQLSWTPCIVRADCRWRKHASTALSRCATPHATAVCGVTAPNSVQMSRCGDCRFMEGTALRKLSRPYSANGACGSHLLHALLFHGIRSRADSDHFLVARERDGIAPYCSSRGLGVRPPLRIDDPFEPAQNAHAGKHLREAGIRFALFLDRRNKFAVLELDAVHGDIDL
jgi:hypothetical protein